MIIENRASTRHQTFRKTLLVTLLTCMAMMTNLAWADGTNPMVVMKTTDGDITIELFADKSPITVENFLRYADEGHFDGTVFHRVIPNFMIQGGGFTEKLEEKPTHAPIVNESRNKLHNTRGTLAMARTSDPDSATAQFFINQRSNLRLDWSPGKDGYTVFGEVREGMQVVDIIALSDTGPAQAMTPRGPSVFQDVPVKPVVILSVSRLSP